MGDSEDSHRGVEQVPPSEPTDLPKAPIEPTDPSVHASTTPPVPPPPGSVPAFDGTVGSLSPEAVARRGRARVLVAVPVVVALVVGGLALMLARGSGTALALSLAKGQHLSYRMAVSLDGTFSFEGQAEPVSTRLSGDVSWRVASVDAKGVATVQMTMSNLTGESAGLRFPSPGRITTSLRIAPDGRIVSGGDLGVAGSMGTPGGLPGSSQITPILPDRAVKPGDSWSKSFDQANPFGRGALHYTARGTLLRYETVGGHKTAVIRTSLSSPLDVTIDFDKLTGLLGGANGLPAGASVAYTGSATVRSTSWVDTVTKQMVRSSASGPMKVIMVLHGFGPPIPDGSEISFDGTVSVTLSQPSS